MIIRIYKIKKRAVVLVVIALICVLIPIIFLTVKEKNFKDNKIENENIIISPVNGYTITSGYGKRIHPISKKENFHSGVDLAVKQDAPIFCVYDGTVSETGYNDVYGNYIIIDHPYQIQTFYGHCSSVKASEKMKMRRGEIIAYVGSTGYSTGPHLHFEIRKNGKSIDPTVLLKEN